MAKGISELTKAVEITYGVPADDFRALRCYYGAYGLCAEYGAWQLEIDEEMYGACDRHFPNLVRREMYGKPV